MVPIAHSYLTMAAVRASSPDHPTPTTRINADETLDARLALKYLNAQLQVNYESAGQRYEAYKSLEHLTEDRSACDCRISCPVNI